MHLSKAYNWVSTAASASSSQQHFGLQGHTLPPLLPLYQCSHPLPTNTECFSAAGHLSPHYNPEAGNEAGGMPYESLYQVSLGKRRGKAH